MLLFTKTTFLRIVVRVLTMLNEFQSPNLITNQLGKDSNIFPLYAVLNGSYIPAKIGSKNLAFYYKTTNQKSGVSQKDIYAKNDSLL
jgi:hypothetical protein